MISDKFNLDDFAACHDLCLLSDQLVVPLRLQV